MFLSSQFLSFNILGAILAANALPRTVTSPYAVKERHFVPRAWTEIGEASKSNTINLHIGLKQRNEGAVEEHLIQVSDPGHVRYGEHLSAAEISELVSPSDETIELVHGWLLDHGISDVAFSPSKDWVYIATTVEKAEELLQTSYKTFKHHDGSTVSRAPEWSLPIHLHQHIDVVQPTTSFFRPQPEVKTWGPKIDSKAHSMSWWEAAGKNMYGGHVSM